MGGLRHDGGQEGGLLQAIRRFSDKFTEAAGIAVHIETDGDLRLNDRLAAEVFQMVTEGLSNIRRHTSSAWARIILGGHTTHLLLQIENDRGEDTPTVSFMPRTITERAAALGGQTQVGCTADGHTVVRVDIPLARE
jgi:signal transduction histidine kinase